MSGGGPRPDGAGFLEGVLRRATGDPGLQLLRADAVGGGCIHHALHLRTSAGDWFAKWNDVCAPDLFPSEAEGLRALRAASLGLAIPEVLVALPPGEGRPGCIVMEYLPPAPVRPGDDEALGRGLAAIHGRPGGVEPVDPVAGVEGVEGVEGSEPAAFGFAVTTYCGPTAQDNRPSGSWAEFYAERRLRPLARRLEETGGLGPGDRRALDRLIERLPALLPRQARAALVHGDLWAGNVLSTTRGPALVDPAAARCDREMEFGITTLFGGFSERFFAAYHEALPLPSGWRERNPLYQLYHLLNHHLIFGGHYGSAALAIARRYA